MQIPQYPENTQAQLATPGERPAKQDGEEPGPLRPLSSFQQAMIALASVAMGAGMTINFVVVSPYARTVGPNGLPEMMVAGILVFSAALYALAIPKWGEIADRYGRKRVMVFSLWAMGLTNMLFLFTLEAADAGYLGGTATIFLSLVFVRIWFGLLSPGLQPASFAAITDATTAKTRAAGMGMLGAAMSVGSVIGPAVAAVLAPFGALVPLWASIIFCMLCGSAIGFALPKTRGQRAAAERPKPLRARDPRVLPHLTFIFIYFLGVAMIQQTLGWFIEDRYDLGRRDAVLFTGIAFACLAGMMVVIQFGYVQPRKPDPSRVLPIGLFLVALGYIGANLIHPFWALCICFAFVGFGAALAVPAANALGSLSVDREEQAGAAALLSAAPPAAFIFGPLIGAGLFQLAKPLPFYIAATVMFVLTIYALQRGKAQTTSH
ncbi:MAG: MFS transporter [Pseudomonadota bacterium]